ncbi:helix-turn-helix domain-containing protein [Bacillus sp. FJAT-28004]|uniref:helix-turn-helix domain-containing protein n=1 Tax=Bacillus sp. FJAT-28004 TaxID=1679165 RepID=UPI0007C78A3D|nr:helix-turn-helix domain-containing protein [Bacillus sp. FJAT-28004]
MRKKEQPNKSYTKEIRQEAVRLHEDEKWTYRQITEKYGIQDKDRVRKWVYRFRKQGEYGLLDDVLIVKLNGKEIRYLGLREG